MLYKKAALNFWYIYRKTPVLESRTDLLHAHLRFYFSLGNTLKNFIDFLETMFFLKNVKRKVMLTEVYLEPKRKSMKFFFCKNS